MTTKPAQDLRKEVRYLLGLVLGREIGAEELPSRTNEATWDSLKNVELMFLLEDHFFVRLSAEEMEQMENVEAIVTTLKARGVGSTSAA